MSVDFVQVDVFADGPYSGNPLAVFPEAGALKGAQMQAIASEMALSETAFVTAASSDRYEVRIFTPVQELSYAGHPTLGTAWVLRRAGVLTEERVEQRTAAGTAAITFAGDTVSMERSGSAEPDLGATDPGAHARLARALSLDEAAIGLEARELGRPGRLLPAFADAGMRHLIVPLRDLDALARVSVVPQAIAALGAIGAYCFAPVAAGRVRARAQLPGIGIAEDPATGSAAAALGLYLAARTGPIDLTVEQGAEIGRPSRLVVAARGSTVKVGGRCALVLTGRLEALP